jgi:golgin subfamily B member 1
MPSKPPPPPVPAPSKPAPPLPRSASRPPPRTRAALPTSQWGVSLDEAPTYGEERPGPRPDVPTALWKGEPKPQKQESFVELEPDELDDSATMAVEAVEAEQDGGSLGDENLDEPASSEVQSLGMAVVHSGDSTQIFALDSADLDSQERQALQDPEAYSAESFTVQLPAVAAAPEVVTEREPPRRSSFRPPPAVWSEDEASALKDADDHQALFALHASFAKRADTAGERAKHHMEAASIASHHLADHETALYETLAAIEDAPADEVAQNALQTYLSSATQKTPLKLQEAARRIERRLGEFRGLERAGAHAALAILAIELKRKDSAREHVSALGTLDPSHPLYLEQRANEARGAGDFQAQKTLLLESLARFARKEDRLRVYLALAELHSGPLNQPKRAGEYFQSALNESPSSLEALQGLERIARSLGDANLAFSMLERQVETLPKGKEQFDARLRTAEELEKQERHLDALSAVEILLEQDSHRGRALAIVERCHAKLGDVRAVVQTMLARAHIQQTPKQKIDILWQAEALQESEQTELAAAEETLKMIVALDPKNLRAFEALERLQSQLGKLDEAVDSGIQIALLTKDKSLAALKLVAMGEILLGELGDRISAKLQFEKALEFDKKNTSALGHLERLAGESGDLGRADVLLERRASLETDHAQATELLLSLAAMREQAGDDRGRIDALEKALARNNQQPHPEVASALLVHYTNTSKWDKAEPLASFLVRISGEANDIATELLHRRTLTMIHSERRDDRAALEAAANSYEAFPEDPGTQSDLIRVGGQVAESLVALFQSVFVRLYEQAPPRSNDAFFRLARILEASSDLERAADALEALLRRTVATPEILSALERVLGALKTQAPANKREPYAQRIAQVKTDLAPMLDVDARFAKLLEAGDIYAREMNLLDQAIRVFEQALPLKPEDPWLRETLAWAYEEVRDYRKLAATLRRDVLLAPSAEARGETLEELAKVVGEFLSAPEEAAQILEERLDVDPNALHAFEKIVRGHTERRDFRALEASYERMIARLRGEGDPVLMLNLWKQRAVIQRDRLGDDPAALDSAYAARSIDESDLELRVMVTELARRTSRPDLEVAMLREWVRDEPLEPRHYVTLYDFFIRSQEFDKAWNALDVLAQLLPLSGEHLEYYDDYPPYEPDAIAGTITEDAWKSHILHTDLDASLTEVFQHLYEAALRTEGRADPGQVPFAAEHAHAYASVEALVRNCSEVLGLTAPSLFAAGSGPAFQARVSPENALSVAPEVDQLSESLSFEVALALSLQRPTLRAQTFYPNRETYVSLLARAAQGEPQLYSALHPEAAARVRTLLAEAAQAGAKVDLRRWLLCMHASAARAALLVCGTAHGAAVYYSQLEGDLLAKDKLGELYQFAVSDAYAELRIAIGVAVGADNGP